MITLLLISVFLKKREYFLQVFATFRKKYALLPVRVK